MKKTIAFLTTTMVLMLFTIASNGGEKTKGITLTEAISIAKEKVPGDVIKAEYEGGHYEIKIRTASGRVEKVYLDAAAGKPVEKVTVTLDEAMAIATNEVPGEVVKVEFERGKYEVKIRTAEGILKEVYVDARSGKITRVKEERS